MKEISWAELSAKFDPQIMDVIETSCRKRNPAAVVVMENPDFSSTRFGHRSALLVGPECTYSLTQVLQPNFRLGDVPSRFEYPAAFAAWKEQ